MLERGDHGSTFAGGPICARAALAALDVIDDPGRPRQRPRARKRSSAMSSARIRRSAGIRGRGLMIGIAPRGRRRRRERSPRKRSPAGLVVNAPNPETIRLLPPLTIDAADLGEGLARLRGALDAVR